MLPNGETHVRNSQGYWVKTNMNGERVVQDPEGKCKSAPSIHSARNIDPETGALVISREDLVMRIEYKDGSILVQHTNGTRIWTYYQQRTDVSDGDDDDDLEADASIPNTLLIEQPGYATVRVDTLKKERVIHAELPDGTMISCKPDTSKNIRIIKEGHQMVVDSQLGVVNVEPRSLMTNGDRPVSDQSPTYYYGIYSFNFFKGGMKAIDIKGNEFMVTSDGKTMVRYHSGIHERQKTLYQDPFMISENNINDRIGLPPVVTEGQAPESVSELLKLLHKPRLFMLKMADYSGTEFLERDSVQQYMELSERDTTTNVSEDYLDDSKQILVHSYLAKYKPDNQMNILLKKEREKCTLPKGIIPLSIRTRNKRILTNIFIHRKVLHQTE
jgi:hypothetical protein